MLAVKCLARVTLRLSKRDLWREPLNMNILAPTTLLWGPGVRWESALTSHPWCSQGVRRGDSDWEWCCSKVNVAGVWLMLRPTWAWLRCWPRPRPPVGSFESARVQALAAAAITVAVKFSRRARFWADHALRPVRDVGPWEAYGPLTECGAYCWSAWRLYSFQASPHNGPAVIWPNKSHAAWAHSYAGVPATAVPERFRNMCRHGQDLQRTGCLCRTPARKIDLLPCLGCCLLWGDVSWWDLQHAWTEFRSQTTVSRLLSSVAICRPPKLAKVCCSLGWCTCERVVAPFCFLESLLEHVPKVYCLTFLIRLPDSRNTMKQGELQLRMRSTRACSCCW